MNKHIATVHEGKKQFKCDICNANFGQKGDRNRHVTTVHEGKKPFKCDICNAKFGKWTVLIHKSHIATGIFKNESSLA